MQAPIEYVVVLFGYNVSLSMNTPGSSYTFENLPAVDSNITFQVKARNIFGSGRFSVPVSSDTGISKYMLHKSNSLKELLTQALRHLRF